MAIHISEALKLPVMKDTKLIAGHKGLNNTIKWVTIVEVLDDMHRLQDGEFLITTAFGMNENEDRLNEFYKLLTSNKLSGIAINTSFYMKEIPESFITAANKSGLPLIEIPTDINFSVITKGLLEQIVNNQMHLLEFSNTIHRKLTNLVLNNQGLTEITNTLAELTSATTLIYNDFYEVVHYTKQNIDVTFDKKPIVKLEDLKINIQKDLIQSSAEETTTHKKVGPYTMTIYPIIAKQACYGWVVIIKPTKQWKELDEIAVGHTATIYAIEFLKREAVEETKMRLQGDFLKDIFNRNFTNKDTIMEDGKMLGYDLSLKQAVFYFRFPKKNKDSKKRNDKLYHVLEQLLNQKNKQHLIQAKMDSLILLTNVTGETKRKIRTYCRQLAQEIHDQWSYFFPNDPLTIGIGKHYDNVVHLAKSAREARYAVSLFSLLQYREKNIIHYDDLGMYDLLLEMKDSGIDLSTIYMDCLENIIPTNNKSLDLIDTLDVYLKNNQSIQTAADQLYIHRHTLRYRLNQIEKRTGLNLKSADDRLKLQIGVMAYRLVHTVRQM
ncbi:PucR family transcriptional regulator [Virgibacillus sp. W0181]|uniref:PucR family transcriptional regulator n=1 Tax=Virgibacillus sp. W0181 TaxID=3391581 RepID=UPI003F454239